MDVKIYNLKNGEQKSLRHDQNISKVLVVNKSVSVEEIVITGFFQCEIEIDGRKVITETERVDLRPGFEVNLFLKYEGENLTVCSKERCQVMVVVEFNQKNI